jgi:hypothetical protein
MRAALETARQRRHLATWPLGVAKTESLRAAVTEACFAPSSASAAAATRRSPLAGTSFLDTPITLYDGLAGHLTRRGVDVMNMLMTRNSPRSTPLTAARTWSTRDKTSS